MLSHFALTNSTIIIINGVIPRAEIAIATGSLGVVPSLDFISEPAITNNRAVVA